MFAIHCPGHGARVLIWPSGVDEIRNHPDGSIHIHVHCTCGWRGILRRPGVGVEKPESVGAGADAHPTARP